MYDAIIIGGGVTGTSIAYQLSKKKGKFLLLEKTKMYVLKHLRQTQVSATVVMMQFLEQ